MVNEDSAHRVRGHAEKMCSILPTHMALVDEPKVDLMDERRRLKRVVYALTSKLAGRDAPELVIDERQQLFERSGVASTPVGQQRRDAPGRGHRRQGATASAPRPSIAISNRKCRGS